HAQADARPRNLHALLLAPGPRGAGHAHGHHRALTITLLPVARTSRSASRALTCTTARWCRETLARTRRGSRTATVAEVPRRSRYRARPTGPRQARARSAGHASRTRIRPSRLIRALRLSTATAEENTARPPSVDA